MSRGGRGRGGGFGRGGFGGFGGDDLKPDFSVTELFPPQAPPVPSALSREERMVIQRFRNHREKIHNGPMYTVSTTAHAGKAEKDVFRDVVRYSLKYQKPKRRVPKLDARPYIAEFFPEELHATLGISDGGGGGGGGKLSNGDAATPAKKKTLALSLLDSLDDIPDDDGSDEDAEDADGKSKETVSRLLMSVTGDAMEEDDEHPPPAEGDEEEVDEFEDDEEGDYNGEQYFDNDDIGIDDYDDDGGGGGGGGGEDWY